jgi:hypothetical protein
MSTAINQQAVAGLTPPALGEARIRDAYPSVAANFAVATLGYRLTQTIILAPIAWLVMSLAYFGKILPITGRKYSLTNRRLMIRAGWRGEPIGQVALADIDDVRVKTDANSTFFRAATLEIVKGGQVVLTLPGVPEPEAFRQSILTAADAWVPGRSKARPFISAGDFKG